MENEIIEVTAKNGEIYKFHKYIDDTPEVDRMCTDICPMAELCEKLTNPNHEDSMFEDSEEDDFSIFCSNVDLDNRKGDENTYVLPEILTEEQIKKLSKDVK